MYVGGVVLVSLLLPALREEHRPDADGLDLSDLHRKHALMTRIHQV